MPVMSDEELAKAKRNREDQQYRAEVQLRRKQKKQARRALRIASYTPSRRQREAARPGPVVISRGAQAKLVGDYPAYKKGMGAEFYRTREWLELRYKAIRRWGRQCMACGATGVKIHIDHIKPRSKFPDLELDSANLQVLCWECNLGKSNSDQTDWRPGRS